MMLKEQAEKCRKQAGEFAGRPEASFLLSVASAFDELATEADARLIISAERQRVLSAALSLHA